MSNIFTPRAGSTSKGGPSLPTGRGLSMTAIVLGAVVVVGLFLVVMSYKTIDQGEIGVKLRWGEAVDTLYPGFHIVLPMESVVVFPTQNRTYTFRNNEELNSYSKDIQEANNRVSVTYSVDGSKAIEVYSKYGPGFLDSIIKPIVSRRFKEIFGKYDAREIVNSREKLGAEIENNVRQNMPTGILIRGVQIENIDFSDEYEKAIEAAAQAEAAVRRARQELEQKKVDAEKVVVQANADAQARVAAAKAEADAIRLKGEAEASAIKAKADALRQNPSLVSLTATEKWDGKLPTTFVPGSTVPFVQVPRGSTGQ